MKKLGFFLLFAIIFATVAVAQNRSMGNVDPKERAQSQTEELKKALDLNKDQEKKVLELNLKSAEEMNSMRQEMTSGGDREAMRAKMTKSREALNAEMKKILTESQYAKYEKYLEERRSMRGQGGPGGQL